MSRILLVTPAFHGYWRSIASALERRGHEVRAHRYDERGLLAKTRFKLTRELPTRVGRDRSAAASRETTAKALAALDEAAPEVVVVVKGDVLGGDFWDALDDRRLPRVLWLYDELRRMNYEPATLQRTGPVASYSSLDVAALQGQEIPASYMPLAFDPHLVTPDPLTRNDEVVFVGARYPRRAELVEGLAAADVPVRVFGRDWSHHPVDRLRTWELSRPALPAGRDLSRVDGYLEMAAAVATLNVHGDQDGFTMRTFEASGVGAVQLIDRTDVGELYEPGVELLTFDGLPELLDQVERVRFDTDLAEGIREKGRARTLSEHTFDHRVCRLEELWSAWG